MAIPSLERNTADPSWGGDIAIPSRGKPLPMHRQGKTLPPQVGPLVSDSHFFAKRH